MLFGETAFAQASFAAATGNIFAASIAETATVTDSVSTLQTFACNTADTVTATDAVFSSSQVNSAVSETATATDSLSANTAFPVSFSDTASVADAISSAYTASCSVSESITATDSIVTAATVLAQIQENITATDTIIRRLLWEQIDDTEVAGWVDILRPQTIGEIMTYGGSFFGDVSFASEYTISFNPLPVLWTDIDDTQTANWTEVVQ